MSEKSKQFKVSVIIPNYNGCELLGTNLPYVISAKNYAPNNISEIVIVDDASTDKSVSLIKDKFSEVKLICHKVNRGFSAAVNTGARAAKGDLLVLLNSDVSPEQTFLASVLKHFYDPMVFAVSFREGGGNLNRGGWAKGLYKDGFVEIKPGSLVDSTHETFWVNGGSGIFRRSYWMELGGMDEKLFEPFYWEDIDICYRAAKRGYKNLWEPKSVVYHQPESTIGKLPKAFVNRIRERNQLLFIWKNITSNALLKKHWIGLFQRIYKHPGYMKIVFLAMTKFRTLRRQRRKEKKEAKISDEAIFAKFQNG